MAEFMDLANAVITDGLFDKNLAGDIPAGQQALIDQAGKLNKWRVTVNLDPPQALEFIGEIEGDGRFTDGRHIITTEVVWVDHKLRWIRTLNSFYRLGKPQSEGDDDDGDGPDS